MKKTLLLAAILASAARLGAAPPAITEVLGRPTDRSVTVNARADAALEMYVEYGAASASYASRTASATAAALAPTEFLLDGLTPDSRAYYRLRYRAAGSTGTYEAGAEHAFHTQRAPGSASRSRSRATRIPSGRASSTAPSTRGRSGRPPPTSPTSTSRSATTSPSTR